MNDPGARNTSFEELRKAYYEQNEALVKGGSDVLLVETIFDTLTRTGLAAGHQLCHHNGIVNYDIHS